VFLHYINLLRYVVLAPIEAPQDVRVSFVDHQSVLLEWMGVYTTINEEPLEGYVVCIHVFLCLLDVCFCSSPCHDIWK